MAAKSVARLMRSSMGPKGMDKMMQSPDGDILISEPSELFVFLGRKTILMQPAATGYRGAVPPHA